MSVSVRPAEVVFLDDAQPNAAAAREFGIHGIFFKENAQAIADIQACLQANAS